MEEERKRQQDLARQRLEEARQRKKMQGENLVRGESIVLPDEDENDSSKIGETILRVLDRSHQKERDLLIKVTKSFFFSAKMSAFR